MIESLQQFTASLPEVFQWLGVLVISAVPFIESYFGSAVGVIVGVPVLAAIAAAAVGNILSMLVFVLTADGLRSRVRKTQEPAALSPRRAKLKARFDQYGVPGVSLLGQLVLPSQISSAAMVSFGASKNQVIVWQIISIIIWGGVFGALAMLGVIALG